MEKYIIITPVRDEEKFIRSTLESVVSQTVKPVEWVIVDDGSKDGTRGVLEEYASRFAWIKVVKRDDRGCRKAGAGVVEAFYDGYAAINSTDWDFVVKLDGDISFSPEYFERCFQEFRKDPDLGICGGTIFNLIDGVPVAEPAPLFHVRGATKIYKKECWDAIGGLIMAPGWDTLDEVKTNMLGWTTRSLPWLEIIHYRPTGAADGTWKNSFKNGRANYICGYHPIFMLLKCVKRLFQSPYLIGAAGLVTGYIGGYLLQVPQAPDTALLCYLRKEQLRKLLGRNSVWN